jgi:hypothetical protein
MKVLGWKYYYKYSEIGLAQWDMPNAKTRDGEVVEVISRSISNPSNVNVRFLSDDVICNLNDHELSQKPVEKKTLNVFKA